MEGPPSSSNSLNSLTRAGGEMLSTQLCAQRSSSCSQRLNVFTCHPDQESIVCRRCLHGSFSTVVFIDFTNEPKDDAMRMRKRMFRGSLISEKKKELEVRILCLISSPMLGNEPLFAVDNNSWACFFLKLNIKEH